MVKNRCATVAVESCFNDEYRWDFFEEFRYGEALQGK